LRTGPRRSTEARYSGNVSKSHGIPSIRDAGSMSSTFWRVLAIRSRSSGRAGAMENPQLPATTVVTPWKQDGVRAGSQKTCAS
jgi:hypothetical protein